MKQKKSTSPAKRKLLYSLLAVLILVICFFGGYHLLSNIQSSNTKPTEAAKQTTLETQSVLPPTTEAAENQSNTTTTPENDTAQALSTETNSEPVIDKKARAVGVFELSAEKAVYENKSKKHQAPASVTKLLTALVALKYVDADTVFEVGTELSLVPKNSSLSLLQPGHRLKLRDLLYALFLPSGNDAAYTVAVNVIKTIQPEIQSDSEAVSVFVNEMNGYAKLIGMKNSHFTSPEGWENPQQYSTVQDLFILAKKALENPLIAETVSCPSKYVVFESGESITWQNSNKMLDPQSPYYNKACAGVKTGSTENSCNLISLFNTKNQYIIIVLGCQTDEERYKLTEQLFKEYCE